jgi:hypothetical protein
LDDLFAPPKPTPPGKEPAKTELDDLFGPEPAAPPAADDDPFNAAVTVSMRQWMDNTGKYQVQAKIVEIQADKVRLFKDNGRYCTVPMHRLSIVDHQYVEQLAAQLGQGVIGQIAGR